MRGLLAAGFSLGLAGPAAARRRRLLTDPDLDAALVVEAASGKVIYARNDAAPRHPASLTKLMTLYLLFETLRAHKLTLQTELLVSAYAASQPRAHLRLRAGSTITVETAIKAMIVQSANDVTVAVAEAVGGSEPGFVALMNAKARAFGMNHTFYHNATGLPDDQQITTADDLVILARRVIRDFPQYFPYFSTRSMTWRGNEYSTHDALIGDYPGVDGMKTGYVDASGYNIVTTALRGKTRLIAVIMGGLTRERRDEAMTRLLDDAYAQTAAAQP
ncbi:MAG: D-alanyl-D-alanine carboxypeptidase [Alphaproteobacteria bacterium]|nr:D-alanyl-D-alanine carboxypeptidase [Alphaproteobacteria bacterium]